MSENEKNETQPPLTIAMVVDTSGNRGNGTSNSALQWAQELERQGHHVRLVGIGAPEYPARVNHVPLVSWVAKKQQMQFAEPSDTLFRKAFDGVDVVHIYTPFRFGQHACKVAKQMGIAVTGRLPRAAGERHVFRGAFEICARHRLVHLLAVRHMAVPQDRPCACADRIGCEPAALAWIQVEAACHLQRLRIAVHAEAAAQGGRAVAGAVPYRRVGTTDQ